MNKKKILIMHKFFCAVIVVSILIVFSSCSNLSHESSSNSVSSHTTTDVSQNSELKLESDSNESIKSSDVDNSNTSVDSIEVTSTYDVKNPNSLCIEDKDAIQSFCNDMCHKWARMYNKIDEADFDSIVQYDSLGEYLVYSINHCIVESMPYSNNSYFDLTAFDIDSGKAIVKGIYKDQTGAYGEYIYVIVNENGKLLLNDMVINTQGSLDSMYRLDFIQSPYPDYWGDYSNYSEIANKTYNSNS